MAQLAALGLQQRSVTGYRHRFGTSPDRERNIDTRGRRHLDFKASPDIFLKSRDSDRYFVSTGRGCDRV